MPIPPTPRTHHRLVLALPGDDLDLGVCMWGWRTNPPPHLPLLHIVCAGPYWLAVILEGPPGRRCFQPDPRLPPRVVEALRHELVAERAYAEACWAADLAMLGWLEVDIIEGGVAITVYVGTENEFVVHVEVPGVTWATWDAGEEQAWLVVEVGEDLRRVDLAPLLFK